MLPRTVSLATLVIFGGVFAAWGLAQTPTETGARVSAEDQQRVIERIGELLNQRYVFPDVAQKAARHLHDQFESGAFREVNDRETFAERLTTALQSVSHDKHMRVRQGEITHLERENPVKARARDRARMRSLNYGFESVQRLAGNVGYVDMRFFSGSPLARETATAAMNFVANCDALIFDMRKNGGGNPDMIRFISSYLFDVPTHLNSLYWREGDRTEEFWTLREVPGKRLPTVPVFVLTSSSTFSGAEEFSYNLKTRKRATLIGETTGGGANPGGSFSIDEAFRIFIPTGRAINPVTGSNWEGVGVEPDVAVDAAEAYDVALDRAKQAAESHRTAAEAQFAARWDTFAQTQQQAARLTVEGKHDAAAEMLRPALQTALQKDLLGEMEINAMGYEYLGDSHPELAIAVFEFNVRAFPESGNVYDSLGEAYMKVGRKKRAIELYRKSLEVDPTNTNAEVMIRQLESDPQR